MEATTSCMRGTIEKVFFTRTKFLVGRLVTSDGENVSFAGNILATEGQAVALAG